MKKFNAYTYCGLFLNGIWLLSIRFNLLPDFFEGLFVGLGLVFILIGLLSERNLLSQLKSYKRTLINKLLSK